jgi:uncharacterized protein involved in exopolysaccharide biosynthesis
MNTHQPTSVGQGLSPSEQAFAVYQEVWQIICRRKGRILLVVMLGLALAALYCAASGPWYDSNAQLLVIKKKLETTPITGPDHVRVQEDFLSTHMLLITSRRVIARAIEKGDLPNLEQFQDKGGFRREIADWLAGSMVGAESEGRREEKLATDIINSLVVTRDAAKPGISPSNEVINLGFRGKVAADCARVLDAIIASYQEFLKETYRNTNAETLELIDQARVMVQKELEAKEAAYQKFLADTPPLWKTQDRSTAHQDRLLKIDARLSAMRMRRAEIEASIAIIEKAIQSGRNPTATVMRMSTTPGTGATAAPNPLFNQEPGFAPQSPGVSLEAELVSLQLQHAKLLTIRPKNHPGVLALDGQIEAVRRMMLPSSGDPSEPARGSAKNLDLGTIKLELLKQELDDLTVAEQTLAKLFENEQKGVSASYIHEIQDEAHRKGIERDRLLYESILNRLKETSSVKDFGGYNTQVIGPALRGALAVKKYVLTFGLSLFCGLFGGFSWACLLEVAAKRSSTNGVLMRS